MGETSTQYKCGECGGAIRVEADYNSDGEFGDTISLEVSCETCGDWRIGQLDEEQIGAEMKRLAGLLGSKPHPPTE